MEKEFSKNPNGNNYLLSADDFYVSYNPNTYDGLVSFTDLANLISDKVYRDGEETALKGKDKKWYILEGDFRKEYQEAFPDYEKCLEVYKKNIDKRSNWSTD